MKKFRILGLTAIVAILTMTLTTSTVLLPNPNDCSSFFMCQNGVPILQKCPEGLHFDASLNVCNWPQFAECELVTSGGGDQEIRCGSYDGDGNDGPYTGGSGGGYGSGEGSNLTPCFITPVSIISKVMVTYCSRSPAPPGVGKCRTLDRVSEPDGQSWSCYR